MFECLQACCTCNTCYAPNSRRIEPARSWLSLRLSRKGVRWSPVSVFRFHSYCSYRIFQFYIFDGGLRAHHCDVQCCALLDLGHAICWTPTEIHVAIAGSAVASPAAGLSTGASDLPKPPESVWDPWDGWVVGSWLDAVVRIGYTIPNQHPAKDSYFLHGIFLGICDWEFAIAVMIPSEFCPRQTLMTLKRHCQVL